MKGTPDLVTAAEIATALGMAKSGTASRLSKRCEAGVKIVRGQSAMAWPFDALPATWKRDLLLIAKERGHRDVGALLSAPLERWESRLPLGSVAEKFLQRARTLKAALAGTLARLNDSTISAAEFRERGLAEYQAAFGHRVSVKQWKRVLDWTVQRDRGAEEWTRLELYLDDNCAPKKPEATEARARAALEHPNLTSLVRSFGAPGSITETQEQLLWQSALDHFEELKEEGMTAKNARRLIVKFLAEHFGKSEHVIRNSFNYKLARWEAGGQVPAAIADTRVTANKERCKLVLLEKDRLTILAYSKKFGGGIAQGFREAKRAGALSLELVERYIENPRNKSHVPRAIRNAVCHDVEMLEDWMHGPRTAKLKGAFIERDPTKFTAGDWFQGDDCTLPNYYYEETARGVRLMRGQFLAMVDCRTTYILGFVLISAELDRPSTYNAWHIRNLITEVHNTYGLPRKGFAFENGTWRSKLLVGGPSWDETEMGLRGFGVRFQHARLPRAKVIERSFGALQNFCEAQPGYVGRNEMVDKYERVQRHKQLVQSGRAPACEHFLSRDEWCAQLERLCEDYNAEQQNGKYLPGISPREGYERYFGAEPLVKLPEEARYLLANEKKKLRVGRNGISFIARGERFTYKGARTGELIGDEVEVFFNYEAPETVGVKPLRGGEAFVVRRATVVDGMDADPEQLRQAFAENAEHDSYKRALYRSLKPIFSEHFMSRRTFRPSLVDQETVEAGNRIAEGTARELQAAQHDRRTQRELAAQLHRIGIPLGANASRTEGRIEAAREMERLMKKAKAEQVDSVDLGSESAESEPPAIATASKKTYTLAPHPSNRLSDKDHRAYWALWGRVQKARPDLDRHALTRRTLGYGKSHKQFTRAEWGRMIAAFTAIIKEHEASS